MQEVCEYLLNEVETLSSAMYDMYYSSIQGGGGGGGGGGRGGGRGGN